MHIRTYVRPLLGLLVATFVATAVFRFSEFGTDR